MKRKNKKMPKGIQSGDNTHHQDQSICPVNFNPMKRTVNNVPSPIPELLVVVDVAIFYLW